MIVNGARSGFFKSRRVVVFIQSFHSTTALSRVQFMPTTRNITVIIHVLIFR